MTEALPVVAPAISRRVFLADLHLHMRECTWFDSTAAQAERKIWASFQTTHLSYIAPKPTVKTVEHIPSADFTASDTAILTAGQKVEHQKFGFGEVIKLEGSAHNPIATVKFDLNGEKKIMLNYAKLMIL